MCKEKWLDSQLGKMRGERWRLHVKRQQRNKNGVTRGEPARANKRAEQRQVWHDGSVDEGEVWVRRCGSSWRWWSDGARLQRKIAHASWSDGFKFLLVLSRNSTVSSCQLSSSDTSGNDCTYVFWVQILGDCLSPYSWGIIHNIVQYTQTPAYSCRPESQSSAKPNLDSDQMRIFTWRRFQIMNSLVVVVWSLAQHYLKDRALTGAT